MATPLYDAVQKHIDGGALSLHTPGHKGQAPLLAPLMNLACDLTEIPAVGSLYDGGDVIEEAEREAAIAFGAKDTYFSGGGCTLAIQTMLALAVRRGGRVLMARNAHRAALHAAALLDADVTWTLTAEPSAVDTRLKADPSVTAVYVTSPDYYGRLADVAALSQVCHRHGAALLVDNAHGSHLGAFGVHPLALGADVTADSAHKTLPVLTGGAMLHVAKDGVFADLPRAEVKATMALFGSTSPSFPVLASLDMAQDWWRREGVAAFEDLYRRSRPLFETAARLGMAPAFDAVDPVRLTLDCKAHDAAQAAEWLRSRGFEPEYADARYVVLLLSPFHTDAQLSSLEAALVAMADEPFGTASRAAFSAAMPTSLPRRAMGLRQAMLTPSQTVPIDQAVGRVSATAVCPCPPGVAVIAPGEVVDEAIGDRLKQGGYTHICVVQ